MLVSRLAVLSQGDALKAAVQASVLRPLREVLEAGVADGAFDVADADLTAHALDGAVSMAALSRLTRDGETPQPDGTYTRAWRSCSMVGEPWGPSGVW